MTRKPVGVEIVTGLVAKIAPRFHARVAVNRATWYRYSVLFLTFLCYTAYHMSRKPLSVVKNVLNQNCTVPNTDCGWAPFNGQNSAQLLGTLDSIFLFAYAFGMFFSGIFAERMDLRFFLTLGMLTSSVCVYLFGIAKSFDVHHFAYFAFVQLVGGLVQTTGWPGVVACIGNWFGKAKRGLIFGIWNSHTSVGNILGSVIAGVYVDSDWSRSFILPALIMAGTGCIIFLFLVPEPKDVGCEEPHHYEFNPSRSCQVFSTDDDSEGSGGGGGERRGLVNGKSRRGVEAISFTDALRIPGVVEFSISLFFSKLVSYTFLYWLPPFIKQNTIFGNAEAAYLSTLFDFGGIVGGVFAGFLSDHSSMSASTCSAMLIAAVPVMFAYKATSVASRSLGPSIGLLSFMGFLVNGPYALITTSVSAELGVHPSLAGNAKAKATVAAIIDGTGSIGAAVGPLVTGFLARGEKDSWNNVFYFLMVSEAVSCLFLVRLVREEWRKWIERRYVRRA